MNIRIKFCKYGAMKFIGHLDMMRYFQKAIRRAGIDIAYSGGYSPHQIMSFASPLGVGMTSGGEYFDIEAHTSRSSRESLDALNRVMSEGVEALEYKRLPDAAKPAMSLVAAADYLAYGSGIQALLPRLLEFYGQERILVTKQTKKQEARIDLKPLTYRMEAAGWETGAVARELAAGRLGDLAEADRTRPAGLFLRTCAGSSDNVKPGLLLEAFCRFCGVEYDPMAFRVHRLEVYARSEEIPVKGETERAAYQKHLEEKKEAYVRAGKPFPEFFTLGELGEEIA